MKKDALEIYESDPHNKGKFKFLACWFILKDQPKWGSWRENNVKKREQKRVKQSVPPANVGEETNGNQTVDETEQTSKKTSPITGSKRANTNKTAIELQARQIKVLLESQLRESI